MNEIHITHGCLEADDDYFEQDVLRGKIDQDTLKFLEIDWYQRKQGFSEKEIREIAEKYFQKQKLTDITVGMRGHKYRHEKTEFWLQDRCYVIDGGQRLYAARLAVTHRPDLKLSIGVKVYFDTTVESENKMFNEMNSTQQRVSASVLLRNKYQVSPGSKLLFDVSKDTKFALKDMIGWDQKNGAGEILTGFALARVAGSLHAHRGAIPGGRAYDLLDAFDFAIEKTGSEMTYNNMLKFFDVVDDSWGIRNTSKRDKPPCLNQAFLCMLARLFSCYDDFWNDTERKEFYMPAKYLKKLAKFDSAKIKQQVKLMSKSDIDAKDVLFEVLRQRLGLKAFEERKPPKGGDDARVGA